MFKQLYQLNVFRSHIEGLDNKHLAKISIESADQKIDSQASATGYEDSPIDANDTQILRLRKTVKKIMHEHIDQRLEEGEIWLS